MIERKINLGTLTEEIVIGNYGTSTDENCCIITEYIEKFKTLARVRKLSLSKTEIVDKEGITSFNCREFTIRNEYEVNYSDTIHWKGNEYKIIAIEPLDDNDQFMIITGKRSV